MIQKSYSVIPSLSDHTATRIENPDIKKNSFIIGTEQTNRKIISL